VRRAAGAAERHAALDVERVEDVLDVVRDVGDDATRVRRREAVAGAVVRDHAEAALARELEVGRVGEPAARRPVVLDDDEPVRIAVVVDVQRPSVAQRDVPLTHRDSPVCRDAPPETAL
jgi:hypothetical protein